MQHFQKTVMGRLPCWASSLRRLQKLQGSKTCYRGGFVPSSIPTKTRAKRSFISTCISLGVNRWMGLVHNARHEVETRSKRDHFIKQRRRPRSLGRASFYFLIKHGALAKFSCFFLATHRVLVSLASEPF